MTVSLQYLTAACVRSWLHLTCTCSATLCSQSDGNAENLTKDGDINMANESEADGTMETVYFGAYNAPVGKGSGSGPWIGADMENGVFYSGSGQANKQANVTVPSRKLSDFVVGFVKGEPGNHYRYEPMLSHLLCGT